MSLITLEHVSLAFGLHPLLDRVSLRLDRGERVGLLGRNGAGKSTLLRVLSGDQSPDAGVVRRAPGVNVARLVQDVSVAAGHTVFEVVAEGLGSVGEVVADYHRTATEVSRDARGSLEKLGRLQQRLDEQDGWRLEQRIEMVLSRLGLPADRVVDDLSGGWRRRTLLAKVLVSEPDVLLLDEPTNHLDIDAIRWLEAYLLDFRGGLLFVTHDRTLLSRLAGRILELDRGNLTSFSGSYSAYLDRKAATETVELEQRARADKRLAEEEIWIRRGIKARRTRNEGRVRALEALRAERAARRDRLGRVRLSVDDRKLSGRLVFELDRVTKTYGSVPVVKDLSLRVLRGDRIGLVGPNGAGKTTLLRLLLGEVAADDGAVRQGTRLQIAYYDQEREQLDGERSVLDNLADGRDVVEVGGRRQHVLGYLKDFLFTSDRAQAPVRALSGGERNRLLLARVLARPANVLVMDEPTNDLDVETLELLEELIAQFSGTLMLVSHDRAFLDHVVTSLLVFEGDGHVTEHVGGYADWERATAASSSSTAIGGAQLGRVRGRASDGSAPTGHRRRALVARDARRGLSYKEQRELEGLPARIEALEAERHEVAAGFATPDLYRNAPDQVASAVQRLEALDASIDAAYARWVELEGRPSPR